MDYKMSESTTTSKLTLSKKIGTTAVKELNFSKFLLAKAAAKSLEAKKIKFGGKISANNSWSSKDNKKENSGKKSQEFAPVDLGFHGDQHILKHAFKQSMKANLNEKANDRDDLITEYITSKIYNLLLPNSSPKISLVDGKDQSNIQLISKLVKNSQPLTELVGLKEIQGFENVLASCLFAGELYSAAPNIAAVISKDKNKNSIYEVIKVRPGRSGEKYANEDDLRRALLNCYSKFTNKSVNLNSSKFKEAIQDILKIDDQEILKIIQLGSNELKIQGVDVENITYKPSTIDTNSFFMQNFQNRKEQLKKFKQLLEVIEKIGPVEDGWQKGRWLKNLGCQNPINWSIENRTRIEGKPPEQWALENNQNIYSVLYLKRKIDEDKGRSSPLYAKKLQNTIKAKLRCNEEEAYEELKSWFAKYEAEALQSYQDEGSSIAGKDPVNWAIENCENIYAIEFLKNIIEQAGQSERRDILAKLQNIFKDDDKMRAWLATNDIIIEDDRSALHVYAMNDLTIDEIEPISWALRHNKKISNIDPIIFAVINQKTIESEDPIAFVIKNRKKLDGKDPVVFAVENKHKIESRDPVLWAIEKNQKIELMNPILWSIDNYRKHIHDPFALSLLYIYNNRHALQHVKNTIERATNDVSLGILQASVKDTIFTLVQTREEQSEEQKTEKLTNIAVTLEFLKNESEKSENYLSLIATIDEARIPAQGYKLNENSKTYQSLMSEDINLIADKLIEQGKNAKKSTKSTELNIIKIMQASPAVLAEKIVLIGRKIDEIQEEQSSAKKFKMRDSWVSFCNLIENFKGKKLVDADLAEVLKELKEIQ